MRLWPKSEEETIPDPGDPIVGGVYVERIPVERIREYTALGGEVPTGVTIPAEEDISIRGIEVREPGEPWVAL